MALRHVVSSLTLEQAVAIATGTISAGRRERIRAAALASDPPEPAPDWRSSSLSRVSRFPHPACRARSHHRGVFMAIRIALALLIALSAMHLPIGVVHAQTEKLELTDADTVKTVLERHVGKRVSVVLSMGQEFTGTVSKVTRDALHLSELTGREFFDAVVPLDRISAVEIRVRSR
jgi:hypothetical protein